MCFVKLIAVLRNQRLIRNKDARNTGAYAVHAERSQGTRR